MTRVEVLRTAKEIFIRGGSIGLCSAISQAISIHTNYHSHVSYGNLSEIFPLFNRKDCKADYLAGDYWWPVNNIGRIKRKEALDFLIESYRYDNEDIGELVKNHSCV